MAIKQPTATENRESSKLIRTHYINLICRSIGKKISASYLDDDEIDFGDLESSLPEAPAHSANEAVASPSNSLTSGAESVQISNGSRRESRGISQVATSSHYSTILILNIELNSPLK